MNISKYFFFIQLFLLTSLQFNAQTKIDSLRIQLKETKNETQQFAILDTLTKEMIRTNHPDQISYLDAYIQLAWKREAHDLMASKSRFRIQQHIYKGENEAALSLIDSMLTFTDHFKKQSSKAHLLLKRGGVYFSQFEYDKALEAYKEAAPLFIQSRDSIFAADAHYFTGQSYNNEGNFIASLNYLEKAYHLYSLLNDLDYASFVGIEMDLIYRRNGLHKEADKLIIELIKMSKKRKSNQTLTSFYIIQASESLNKNQLDTARVKLDSVTKYIELTKDIDLIKKDTYLANILSLRYHLEKKQIDSADYHYNALIDLENNQLKFIYLIAQANSAKVSYLKTKNRISEALDLLDRYKKQNAIGQDTNYNDLEVEKLYAELYSEQNQPEKAIIHYKKYIDIKNQLDKQVTQNAYAYYQARFNTASKEKEILQQQTEILQLENEKTIADNKRNNLFFALCLGILCMVSIGYFMFQKERRKRKRVARKLASNERELALFTKRLLQKSKEQESLFKEIDYLKNEIGEKVSVLNLQELASSKILTLDDWYNFKQKFIAVYPLFFTRIEKQGYKLTKSEERLVALEKLELTSHEIANLLGISFDSVNTNRYRLRKKINAPKEIPIVDYLEKDNLQKQFSDSQ